MPPWLRIVLILSLLLLAISVPVLQAGYADLQQAALAATHLERADLYLSAARRLPWRADLYELAGHEYYYAGEYASADVAYQRAERRNALSPEGWVAWGDVNYLNGDTDRAAALWKQGLAQENFSEDLYSRLAQTYKDQKDFAASAQYLQLYTTAHLEDASARYRLGLLLTLTNPNTALDELLAASQINPEFDPATQTLRSALNVASLTESLSMQKVIIGRGLALVGEWELAQVAFEQAVQLDESNAEAWAWLAEAQQQVAKSDAELRPARAQAFENLQRAVSLDPNSVVVRTLRGLYYQRIGDEHSALTELQVAVRLSPQDPALQVSLGDSYARSGDLIAALQAYQTAAALTPGDVTYWRRLAQFSAANQSHVADVGVPAAQQAVVLSKDNANDLDLLGWLLVLSGRYPEAERQLQRALALDPQLASAHFHLGMLYLQTDQPEQARASLLRARDLGSTEAQAVLNQSFP